MMRVEDRIREALKKVTDPELGVSIVDLGLIYDIRFERSEAKVEMTLTSPGCPLASVIDSKIRKAVSEVTEVKKLTVELVWDPPWSKELLSDELKAEFGF